MSNTSCDDPFYSNAGSIPQSSGSYQVRAAYYAVQCVATLTYMSEQQ